ncbi:MAG: hypothetical protein KAJ19_22450, partial [Gammaproteobacteria bacterium]|nr:hypothetical protein [Gammaproteobacteria bacterium]
MRELIGRTNDNLGLIASTMDDASHITFHERVRQWAQTPIEAAAEQSIKVLGGPEGYITGLALRDFVTQVGDEMVTLYDMTAPQRRTLENLSERLGVSKEDVLQRIGEAGDADVLFEQLVQRSEELVRPVEEPEGERLPEAPIREVDPGMVQAAADILRGIERGEINAQGLRDMFKVYGEDGVAYTLGEWKAQYVSAAIEHAAHWGIGEYNVQNERTINRFANAIKGAQSLVLLGANPVYFFNNLWNGEVTMAATGVWGLFAPDRMEALWKRIGFEPYRIDVGVGAADIGEGKGGRIADAAEMAVRRATQEGGGAISKVNEGIRTARDKTGVFTKAAQIVERWQSRRSFTAGFLQMWKRLWRQGVGYDRMPPALEGALRDIDPNLPGAIYGIIDAGMNQGEVESALFGGIARNVESFLPDVASEMGIPPEELGEVLAQTGALNYLSERLRPGMSEAEVHGVFDELENEVQVHLDDLAAQEIANRANEAAARIVQARDTEGNVDMGLAYEEIAGLFDEVYLRDLVWWNDHFLRWSQTMDLVEGKTRNLKNMIVGARMATANREANRNKAYMESTLQGILRGLGEAGVDRPRGLVANVKRLHEGWTDYFTKRDSNLREHFAKDFDTGTEARSAWEAVEAENSRLYVEYGKNALTHQEGVDRALVKWIEKNVSPAAAEAIAGRREKLLDHQRDMMNVMYQYRQSLVGMSKKQRNAAWRLFLNETYMPMIAEFERLRMTEYRDLPGAPPLTPAPEGEPPQPGGPDAPDTPIREIPPPKDLVQSRDRVLKRYDIEGFTEYASALHDINKHLPEGVNEFAIKDYHQPENVERIADLRKTLEARKVANDATEKVRAEAQSAGEEIASRPTAEPDYDHPEPPEPGEEEAPPTEYAAAVHVDAPIPDIPRISELAAAGPGAGIVAHEHMLNFLRKHVDAEITSLQTMTPDQIARGIEALNLRGQELVTLAEAEGVPVTEVTEAIAAEPVIETETFVPEPPKGYKPLNEVPKEGEIEQQLLDISQTLVNRTEGMPELHRESEVLKLRETIDRALTTYPGDKGLLETNMWYRGLRDLVVSVEKQWKYEHRGTKDVRPIMPFIPRFSDTARPSFKGILKFDKLGAEGLRIITHEGDWNTGQKGWGQSAMWVSGDPADLPYGKFGSRPDFTEKTLTVEDARAYNLSNAVDKVMAFFDDASTLTPVEK